MLAGGYMEENYIHFLPHFMPLLPSAHFGHPSLLSPYNSKFFLALTAFRLAAPSTSVAFKLFDLTIVRSTLNIVTHVGMRAYVCMHTYTHV